MSERLSWDQYFMTITLQVAERSTCARAKVGAVIARDKNILATGYNGAPAGMPHCTDVGCLIYESKTPNGDTEQNCFRTIHAEMNAIAQAAKNGSNIKDGAIWVNGQKLTPPDHLAGLEYSLFVQGTLPCDLGAPDRPWHSPTRQV